MKRIRSKHKGLLISALPICLILALLMPFTVAAEEIDEPDDGVLVSGGNAEADSGNEPGDKTVGDDGENEADSEAELPDIESLDMLLGVSLFSAPPYSDPDLSRAGLEVGYDTAGVPASYKGVARSVPSTVSYGWEVGDNPARILYDEEGGEHTVAAGFWNESEYIYNAGSLAEIGTIYESTIDSRGLWMIGGRVKDGSADYPVDADGNAQPFDSYSHHTGRRAEDYRSYSNTVIHIGEFSDENTRTADGILRHVQTRRLWSALFGITESVDSDFAHFLSPTDRASGVGAASRSSVNGFENPTPDGKDDYWAVFYGATFNNVYIETHFPVYFYGCTFNHCTIDSRSSNDLVFYDCRFYGGMQGKAYVDDSGSDFKGVIYSSGGKNIVLSNCLISGGTIDDGLEAFIYSASANVYFYDTTVDASFTKDIISIRSAYGHEASAYVKGGIYRGCGKNNFIHNIGASVARIEAGSITGFAKALYIETGGIADIVMDGGDGSADVIGENGYGAYLTGSSTLNFTSGRITESGTAGVYLCNGSTLEMAGGSIAGGLGDGVLSESYSNIRLGDGALISGNAGSGANAKQSFMETAGSITGNGADGITAEECEITVTGGSISENVVNGINIKGSRLALSDGEVSKNKQSGIEAAGSELSVTGGVFYGNEKIGIDLMSDSRAEISGGHIFSSEDGVRVSDSAADIAGDTLITENQNGIYAADDGAAVSMSGGAVAANGVGIYINEAGVTVTGGVIGEASSGGESYATNDIGIYQNGSLTLGGSGYIEDRKGLRDRGGVAIADVDKNAIYLANVSRYVTVTNGMAADVAVNAASLGQLDIPREEGDTERKPLQTDAVLGRTLFYVTDEGAAEGYVGAFSLADGIRAYNTEPHDTDNGNGDGWHEALIAAGNGPGSDGYGNVTFPVNAAYASHGVLSGIHRADFSEEDGKNVYISYSLASSGMVSGTLDDRVELLIQKNGVDEVGQSFVWRDVYKAIGDGDGNALYSAQIVYKDSGEAVPYLAHTGWVRGTDDGIDRNDDGTPMVYGLTQTAELTLLQTDHNFDWCPVFSYDFDIVFDGNEYSYINRRDGTEKLLASGRSTVSASDVGLLPAGAKLNGDRSRFTVGFSSESIGMTLPELCFDLQFFISAASKGYYDYGREKYVDHYVEYSQQGWSYDSGERYDGAGLMKNGEPVFAGDIEASLEALRAEGRAGVTSDRFTVTIYAILDEAPDIQAYDRYYTSEEIQNMGVDDFIKDLLAVNDPETGEELIWTDDKEDDDDKLQLELLNFNQNQEIDREREFEQDFKNIANTADPNSPDMGGASVTYRVTDGAGNTTYYSIMIYITSSYDLKSKSRWHADTEGLSEYDSGAKLYVRFIDEWNYKKNPFWDRALFDEVLSYTDEEFKVAWNAYLSGAEQPYSKWYTEAPLVRELTEGFETLRTATSYKDYESSYTFTWDDLREMQDYIKANGIGKTRDAGALTEITDFMEAHRTTAELEVNNDGNYFRELAEVQAAEKADERGIYIMGYPRDWLESDPWQQGKYVRYTYSDDGRVTSTTQLR